MTGLLYYYSFRFAIYCADLNMHIVVPYPLYFVQEKAIPWNAQKIIHIEHTHTHNKITVHVEASHSWGKINSDKYQWIIANKPGKRGLGTSTNEQKMNIHLLNKIVKFIENLKYAIAFKFELKIIFHSINLLAQCDRRSLVIRIFLFHFLIVRLYFHAAFSPSLSRLKFSRSTEWVR